ncbi:MAG: endonuclease MutS2 [Chloroflexota bacterium]
MDKKTLITLEYDKVLARLAEHTAFSASREEAFALKPSTNFHKARQLLAETAEARLLFEAEPSVSVGGGRDIREQVEAASRGIVLVPTELLDIKYTLISIRRLGKTLEREALQYPYLAELILGFPGPLGLVDSITQKISDRGEILDTASEKLTGIRKELRITHERLLAKMQKFVSSDRVTPYLQESLVTQREGRYVVPVKAEARGRVKGVVHGVSSSGATLFIEPMQIVDINNSWREIQANEQEEERRILAEISAAVGEHADALIEAVKTLARLDLIFAKAKYAEELKATQPVLKRFKKSKVGINPGMTLKLWQARHPLLEPEMVVPIDIDLDPETYTLLITGPNTGGKTVTLKTVGLLACMTQSGMHIPVLEGSEINLFKAIYADIGDEQSIEQSLSTFSGHITNMIKILNEAKQDSLVILDELGAGTDPQEGAALARGILTFLVERGIPTMVATHYPELKTYAHGTPGVINASMAFDLETLRPTYHLTIGLPGRSNALAIAQKLGLRQEIIDLAKQEIDPAELKVDDLLDEIHRQHELAQSTRAETDRARKKAEALRDELAGRLEEIEDERIEVLAEAQEKAQAEINELQEEIRKTRRQLAQARQPLDVIEEIEEDLSEIAQEVEAPVERVRLAEEMPSVGKRPIRLGDKVLLRTLGKDGVVTSLGEDRAEIMIGNLRVRVELYDLDLIGGQVQEKPKQEKLRDAATIFNVASPGVELPLRGMTVDEALEKLDSYLDQAFIAGLPYVRIVHGKGTGKLREAVRRELSGHSHIQRFEKGGINEGGDGVTVAFMAKN